MTRSELQLLPDSCELRLESDSPLLESTLERYPIIINIDKTYKMKIP